MFGKLISNIANAWWTFWSNIRFSKSIREDVPVADEDKVKHFNDINPLTRKLYKNFNYTSDGIDQLWDAITPPPQNYVHYQEGELKDDCDGFHSLLYHCFHASGIECYLMSVNALGSGHCVLLFKYDGLWFVNDYTRIYGGKEEVQDMLDLYNKEYKEVYQSKHDVYANGLVAYDYNKGKFYQVKIKSLK